MTRTSLRAVAAVFLALFFAGPSFAQDKVSQSAPDNVIYPILGWLPLYGADLSLPSGPPCTGCPSDPTTGSGSSSGLSSAWFAGGRLEFGRLELVGNWNYAGLTAEKDRPFFKADVKVYTAVLLGGVRVAGPLFLEAGARYHGLHATLSVLTYPAVDWDPGRWTPAVGASARPRLGKHWLLFTHLDFAGLGVHDVSTVNGDVRIEWRPTKHLAITGGYAFAKVTLDGRLLENTSLSRPIHFEQTLHGPSAGIGIPF
jgi:hypothetical protein